MLAQAFTVIIVCSIVGGAAGRAWGDIYGIAMGPLVGSDVTRPDLVKGASSSRKCNQCSCKITWDLKEYKQNSCKTQFEFTCTCNAYTCEKREIQHCMALVATYF
uniref:Uncharacterized protein n=1 Tax=Rhipicephalus zambeziensis TaxID=60191 RepID=A0A224YF15_9ACAR